MRQGRLHWAAIISVVTLYGLVLSPRDPLMTDHAVPHQTVFVLILVPFAIGLFLGRDAALCLPLVFPVLSIFAPGGCVTHKSPSAFVVVCNEYDLIPFGVMLAVAVFVFARSGALFARGFRSAF